MGGATKSRTAAVRAAALKMQSGGMSGGKKSGNTADKLNAMSKMSSDERADVLQAAFNVALSPGVYNQGITQQLVEAQGLNAKPALISDKEFDAIASKNGITIYRTVKNTKSGITGKELLDNTLKGDINSLGSGIYGAGHYFATNYSESVSYGDDKKGQGTVRATFNKKDVKIIEMKKLQKMYADEVNSSSKLYDVCDKIDRHCRTLTNSAYGNRKDILSAYALTKGYDAIYVQSKNYYTFMTRDKLVFSSYIKDTANDYGDKW